jgi:hypothetical protein
MNCQKDFTLPAELLEQIASEGLDFLPELVRILINAATQIERGKHLVLVSTSAHQNDVGLQTQDGQNSFRRDHL